LAGSGSRSSSTTYPEARSATASSSAVGAVTHKVLTQQLKELEADGIVKRMDHGEIPPHVDYSLTKFEQSLAAARGSLCQWGTDHVHEIERVVARRIE
jgi:DNA-binding HxlR family transcriptional regulator